MLAHTLRVWHHLLVSSVGEWCEIGARLVRDAAPVCSHLDVRGRESHSIPIAIAPHTSSILTICIFILGVGPHTEILAEEAREYSNIA